MSQSDILEFIKPELLALIPALYILGSFFKKSYFVRDESIPIALGIIGIALALLWVLASSETEGSRGVFEAIFTAVVQGLLVAGAAVYLNQVNKQCSGGKEKDS